MQWITVALVYFGAINLYGFTLMYRDKQRSMRHQWRITEARLFTVAALFGSPGIWAGMRVFRHKTKHNTFVFGIPAIFIVQVYLVIKLIQWL